MRTTSATLLSITALFGISFFIFLFLGIRCDPDDMIISNDLREHSTWYVLKSRYLFSSCRYTLLLLDGLLISSSAANLHPVYIFFFYLTLILAITILLHEMARRFFQIMPANSQQRFILWIFAVTQVLAVYFLVSSRIEIFGWLAATEAHLVPVIAAGFALLLITRESNNLLTYLGITGTAFVIAGGAEHITIISLGICVIMLLFVRRGNRSLPPATRKKTIFFALFLLAFFLLIFSGPGKWSRVDDVQRMLATHRAESPGVLLEFFQTYKLMGIILVLAGVTCLGQFFQINPKPSDLRFIISAGIITIAATIGMSYLAYHEYGPGRIWLPIDILTYVLLVILFVRWNAKSSALSVGLACIAFLAIVWYCARHIPSLMQFRQDYNAIVYKLKEGKPNEIVQVPKNPSPDLVNYVNLTSDPGNETNILFCRYHNSKAKVSVSTEQ